MKINYVDHDMCAPKHVLSAKIEFKVKDGAVVNFFETREMINCWVDDSTERGRRILSGKSTKLP